MNNFGIQENDDFVAPIKAKNDVDCIEEAVNRLLQLPSNHPARLEVMKWADEILD